MGKNWMTTVAGLISAATSLVLFMQQEGYYMFPHWVMGVAMFANVGGLAGLGITAKQFNVTGGSKGQPSTPEALAVANQAPSAINPPVPTQPIVPPVVIVKPAADDLTGKDPKEPGKP